MYNRYIRREDGTYTKVSEAEPAQAERNPTAQTSTQSSGPQPPPRQDGPQSPPSGSGERSRTPPPFSGSDGAAGFLRRILDQLHLDRVDAGDLLLLGLLYFLFREKADEELLVALGLLLIL